MTDKLSATNSKFNQLIAALGTDLELTGEEIADIIWFAQKCGEISERQNDITSQQFNQSNVSEELNPTATNTDSSEKLNRNFTDTQTSLQSPAEIYPITQKETQDKSQDRNSRPNSNQALALRIPDAPSIREPLTLAQVLKPLMLRVESGKRTVLDETATVERTAAEGICTPILKHEAEPWLDVALVVDESKSMLIWRHTIWELKRLLEHYGVFRDVGAWGLVTNENGQIHIRPGIGQNASQQRFASPREILDPNRRRLILLVSDCVATTWRNGALTQVLKDWTNTQPVAIIQMLPDWLWLKTGLGLGAAVRLRSLTAGVANKHLLIKQLLLWKDINLDTGIKIPVLTLEPDAALAWSQMLAGKSDAVASGFVLSSEIKINRNKQQPPTTIPQVNAQERVYRFRMTASPMARKLAGLLAAAPVINLPVVRLIQETLLPKSRQVHVAEVFLGGLLKPLTPIEADTLPDTVQYDFMNDEIRGILLEASPVKDSTDVLDAVSEYVAAQLGKSLQDFVALLKAPGEADYECVKPFAEVTGKILKQLGGDYALFARELKQGSPLKQDSAIVTKSTEASEVFEGFPTLQTFEFEITTISIEKDETRLGINLRPFTFEVALVEVNQSTHSNKNNLLETADEIIFTQTGKHLNYIELLVLQGALENKTYKQIAASEISSEKDLKLVGLNLWKVFSEVVGERVNKQNLPNILKQSVRPQLIIHRHQKQNNYFVENLRNGIELEMVQIPGGIFTMGAPEDEEYSHNDERPHHEVIVPTFFMGKYSVTQAQWRTVAFLPRINRDLKPEPSRFKGDNRPVECISWFDGVEFCDRLSQYTDRNYRLPNEAEWEYACRAGATTPFHFGEIITPELANYNAQSTHGALITHGALTKKTYRGETTEVGSFGVANAFGLYDMHGNLREWCADQWHENYEEAPTDGSAWVVDNNDNDNHRVLRGGSWYDNSLNCRCASRGNLNPFINNSRFGLRVVCNVSLSALP